MRASYAYGFARIEDDQGVNHCVPADRADPVGSLRAMAEENRARAMRLLARATMLDDAADRLA